MFLLKALTIVVSIVVVLVMIAGLSRRSQPSGVLTVDKLNEKYRQMADVLQQAVLNKASWKKREKLEKKAAKQHKKAATTKDDHRKRIYVLDFKGDIRASEVANFREEVTAIASVATDKDEVKGFKIGE